MRGAQLSIEDAIRRRDAGIARAEAGALESWKSEAFATLRAYLETHEQMHVDDLAPLLPSLPTDRRALGPVILKAVRLGLMTKSGEYRMSRWGDTKPVWTSLVCARGEGERKP